MNLGCIWRPGDSAPTVAVGIARMPGRNNTHTGIIYRVGDGSDDLRWLHLAFHKTLCDDLINGRMLWFHSGARAWCRLLCTIPDLEEEDRINVAIYCRGIARHRPEIAYGLSYEDGVYFDLIDDDARLLAPEEKKWLYCSTFVLAVFKSAGPKLIDPTGWPDRPDEDSEWQAQLVAWLRSVATPEHIRRVEGDVGKARIRPEETAGACLMGFDPQNR